MRKMMAALLMALCMMLSLLPVTALAMEPEAAGDGFVALNGTEGTPVAAPVVQSGAEMPVVEVDVSGADVTNEDYEINSSMIKIRKPGKLYKLTGSTTKDIRFWGSHDLDNKKEFYLCLNGVTTGAIGAYSDPDGMTLSVEVAAGTTNTVARLNAVNLTIFGSGTLNASSLGITESKAVPNVLTITDTTINVNVSRNSDTWHGTCVLTGSADVTYTGNGNYAPLQVGESGCAGCCSLTIEDHAKLRCLQPGTAVPAYSVNGLETFGSASITVKGNGYLKAEGRDSTSGYAGCGIMSQGNISIEDKGTIEATGYNVGLRTSGKVSVNGGKIIATGIGSNGIYAGGGIEITNGAYVKAEGYWPALYGDGDVVIKNSTVDAISNADVGIFANNADIVIADSVVNATGTDDVDGIYANGNVTVSNSWIVTSGDETLDSNGDSITNSVLFNGKDGKVIGEAKLLEDAEIAADMTLVVPEGTKLTVPDGMTLTNNGTMDIQGEVAKVGSGETLCGTDDNNHTMKHFPGKAATKTAKGMKEYWQCLLCGNTFLDQSGSKEVTDPAQLVIPKLADDNGNNGNNGNNGSQHVNRRYPANTGSTTAPADDGKNVTSAKTGDMGVALYAVTALLSLSGGAWMARKRK